MTGKVNGLTQKKVMVSSNAKMVATYSYISPLFNPKVSKLLKKVKQLNLTLFKATAVNKLPTLFVYNKNI